MELCSSYLTLAGSVYGQPPVHSMSERAEAAMHAGFLTMGACVADSAKCAYFPSTISELEFVDLTHPNWDEVESLWYFADRLGSIKRLKCGSVTPPDNSRKNEGYPSGMVPEANNLRVLAQQAADHGIKVCVEPVAWGSLPTLDMVLRCMAEAGGQNMCIMYDTWQVYRTEGKLPFIDASAIGAVEISGSHTITEIDARSAAMNRLFPEYGVEYPDLINFLTALWADGYQGPINIEVPSRLTRERPCSATASLAWKSVMKVLDDASR